MKHTLILIACAFGLLISGCNSHSSPNLVLDPPYTFVVAGDGRGASQSTKDNPSASNLPFLKKLFADVDSLQPKPQFLFYNGDLVYGFDSVVEDTNLFKSELIGWIDVYKASDLYKKDSNTIKLVIVPGNHEIDSLVGAGKDKKEYPMLAKERIFARIMGRFFAKKGEHPYIVVHKGPTPISDPLDSLGSDQSRLTYSFDFNLDHFVVFNTDPFPMGNRVPWHWLKADLDTDAARNSSNKVHHIFLFGHKPPFGSKYYAHDSTSMDFQAANRDSMWKYIELHRCDAYFGSHIHLWDAFVPEGGSPWEIVCGNGGAPMPKSMHWTPPAPSDGKPYFGYTQVKVSVNGVIINSFSMDTCKANDNKLKYSFNLK